MIDKPGDNSVNQGNADAALLHDLAALPKAIAPAQDQWQHISQRIAGDASGNTSALPSVHEYARRNWLALAASVLLVAVTGFFVMQAVQIQTPAPVTVADSSNKNTQQTAVAETIVRWPTSSVEREYQAAFREFVSLDPSKLAVSVQTRTAMVQDWELMQQLERDLSMALEQEPENPLLLDRWLQLRASQLQLLHVIAETGQWPGRTLI